MTPGSPRTASARRGSSASTPGRWARSATVRSRSRCTPSAPRARCRWGSGCICPRTGVQDPSGGAKAKIPADVEFQTKPALGGELVARAAGWKIRRAPVLGDQAYGNDAKLRTRLHADGIDYVLVDRPGVRRLCARHGLRGPAAQARLARPRAQRARAPTASRSRSPSSSPTLTADAWQTVAFRDIDGEQLVSRFAFVRVIAAHPVDPRPPGAARGMADRRMARRPRAADRLLDQQPARRHRARAARAPGPAALDDRARLQAAQGRTRPRPLRRPQLPRLSPPLHARHRRPRLPDPGAGRPKSPAAGLTLPQTVLLLQPVFQCWTGRCSTCQQPDRPHRSTAPPTPETRVTPPTRALLGSR